MGLDQTISIVKTISAHTFQDEKFVANPEHAEFIKQIGWEGPIAESYATIDIIVPVLYWRKFNALHGWFANKFKNLGNGSHVFFYRETLWELYDVISDVLSNESEEYALEVFPPMEGFFFGGTGIDEWYWDDLRRTKSRLDNLFTYVDQDTYFAYMGDY